jgi:hypothetical protein
LDECRTPGSLCRPPSLDLIYTIIKELWRQSELHRSETRKLEARAPCVKWCQSPGIPSLKWARRASPYPKIPPGSSSISRQGTGSYAGLAIARPRSGLARERHPDLRGDANPDPEGLV